MGRSTCSARWTATRSRATASACPLPRRRYRHWYESCNKRMSRCGSRAGWKGTPRQLAPLLPRDGAVPLSQCEFLYFPGRGLRQFTHEAERLWNLEMREPLATELAQVGCGGFRALAQHDERVRRFAPFLMRHADHCGFKHGRVTQQYALELDRRDILPAADNHVLVAVADLHVAVRMHHSGVPRMEPAAAEGLRGCFRIVVVPLHHDVSAHHDLA